MCICVCHGCVFVLMSTDHGGKGRATWVLRIELRPPGSVYSEPLSLLSSPICCILSSCPSTVDAASCIYPCMGDERRAEAEVAAVPILFFFGQSLKDLFLQSHFNFQDLFFLSLQVFRCGIYSDFLGTIIRIRYCLCFLESSVFTGGHCSQY